MSFRDELYRTETSSGHAPGARYADNDYDRRRYGRVLSLSARLVAAIEQRSPDEVMVEYKQNLARVTPFVAADAAVLDGCILLIKRGLWECPAARLKSARRGRSRPNGSSAKRQIGRNCQEAAGRVRL